MKILIITLLSAHLCFSQNIEPSVDLTVDAKEKKVMIKWSDSKISEVKITLPDLSEIVFPTLGETQLNIDGYPSGAYLLELIEDKNTRKTLKIYI